MCVHRAPGALCTVFHVRCVCGPVPHTVCTGGADFLPDGLQAEASGQQEAAAAGRVRQRQQRLRLRLGHGLGPVRTETPALRAHTQHKRLHLRRGAGASTEAGGKREDHP